MKDLLYIQQRLGKDGHPIRVYKIRTMVVGADQRLDEIVGGGFDGHGKPLMDPRVTLVGMFLRRYWVDELPQLYNLSRGDIKLVGIRPTHEADWKRYPGDVMERALKQKPGLMGVQYAYQHTDSFSDHLNHLREYLDSWEENPTETDRDYLSRIVKNIIFGRVRSS